MKATRRTDNRSIRLTSEANEAEIEGFRYFCNRTLNDVRFEPADAAADEDATRVLFVGIGCAQRAERHAHVDAPLFDLLITHDESVLDHPDVLRRCANVLLAPYDAPLLSQYLDALFHEDDVDPEIDSNLIGKSRSMRELRRAISRVARSDAPVLIKGETGTGKELVARAIHYGSLRCDQAFVPVNCGALNDELLLADLFGYEKGAFTDAKRSHRGLVEQATGGVLFMDEIDSLSLKGQAALLRFLQDQEYRPLGSETARHGNVRVLTATNKDLHTLVTQGRFREDLYYRVHLLDLDLPPLRAREGDIGVLAEHFLVQLSERYRSEPKQLHPLTLRWMSTYAWPGNVRELQHYLHRLFVMSNGSIICVPHVKGDPTFISLQAPDDAPRGYREEKARVLAEFERAYLHRVMKVTQGNVSRAARHAGKERCAFRRLLKKHGIERRQYDTAEYVKE